MNQNRTAPAYQEYPASMMASTAYRLLSLAERGLLYSLRLECWCNGSMPADPAKLARILGYDAGEVAAALPRLEPFFDDADGALTCPELDDYRAYLDERRARQSEGGKRGAARTNAERKPAPRKALKSDASNPRLTRRGTGESLVQQSPAQPSKDQSNPVHPEKAFSPVDDDFVRDYDRANERCPF